MSASRFIKVRVTAVCKRIEYVVIHLEGQVSQSVKPQDHVRLKRGVDDLVLRAYEVRTDDVFLLETCSQQKKASRRLLAML